MSASYDLLPTMSRFLDPQLAFALLEFIRTREIYKDSDIVEAQIKLLKATNMVEFTMELYNELHGPNTAPKEMEERRDAVLKRISELQENSKRIIEVISDKNTVQNLKADRNLNITFLKARFSPNASDTQGSPTMPSTG
jgi:translation initiation factor 3 subunit E